jgi:mannosyltransferase
MILFDNVIFSIQKSGGISTYWGEILDRITVSDYDYKIIEREDSHTNIVRKNIFIPDNKIIRPKNIPLLLDRINNISFKAFEKTVFHSSYFRNIHDDKYQNFSTVLTIHDFIPERFYTGLKLKLHTIQKKNALKKASKIIVVSESTKNDLIKFHPWIDESKIVRIYNGVSDKFIFNNNKYNHTDIKRLLYVGSRVAYKNFISLVKIISKLNNFKLIIVGPALSISEISFLNQYLGEKWESHVNVSLKSLNNIYSSSFALIYPSLYEGFGIPILESMRSGCPVIALRNSSIPEVSGSNAVLLEELTLISLQQALNEIEGNREKYINQGYSNSINFSWEKCFNETMNVYKSFF